MFSLPGQVVGPVALLARVSGEDQARNETIQPQIEFLKKHAELYQLRVAGLYIDDGVSGAIPLEDRPEGRRLVADAAAGLFTQVIVYRLDRLGRTLKVLIGAHDRLDACGVSIKSATEPFDTTTPFGKAMFQFLGIMAELERSTISERTRRGRDVVAGQGRYTGGPIPYGYDLDADRRFIPSARIVQALGVTEADLIRDLYRRLAYEGATLNGERQRLDALGVPCQKRYPAPLRATVRDRRSSAQKAAPRSAGWAIQTLSQIVRNRMYRGAGRLDSAFGAVARPSPALVDAATWDAAQAALTRNRQLSKRNAKNEYLLRGLVRCALCGYTYTGHTYEQNGVTRRWYRCIGAGTARHPSGRRCRGARVKASTLEAAIWSRVRAFVEHPEQEIAAAQAELRSRLAASGQAATARTALLRQIAAKDGERQTILTLLRRGTITTAECERELGAIADETRLLREQADAIGTQLELAAASEAYLSDVGAAIVRLQENLAAIEAADDGGRKREYIERLTSGIWIETEVRETGGKRVQKTARLRLRLALRGEEATASVSPTPNGDCRPLAVDLLLPLAS